MSKISSISEVGKLGTILCVWAHPDDETFCAGGLLATATMNGQKVICITATRGEAGVQDVVRWPAEKLAEIREQEMQDACKILGVKDHIFLDCLDGECAKNDATKHIAVIKAAISKFKPNTILTFGPDGLTGHSDHSAVSTWVIDAVADLKKTSVKTPKVYFAVHTKNQHRSYLQTMDEEINMYFNTDEPPVKNESDCDICLDLPRSIRELKTSALKAMPSQTDTMFTLFGDEFIAKALGVEAFVLSRD